MYIREESYDTALLKAERDLATSGYELPVVSPTSGDDTLPMPDEKALEYLQRHPKPAKLEDYQPGASRTLVLDALKKVAKSPKPSPKRGEQPESTS